jgi:hypothetical protein
MAGLRPIEMRLIVELCGRNPGYVLNFSNAEFEQFFAVEVGVNILDPAYDLDSNSKGKRFRAFLQRADPAVIAKALTAFWEYRADFLRREKQVDDVDDAHACLKAVIARLSGAPPSGAAVAFPGLKPSASETSLHALQSDLKAMHSLAPQRRGYAFEGFLKAYFDVWGMDARGGFRTVGEQIDGSFVHDENVYLLEAKWQNKQANAATLLSFQGKVQERPVWARGLFVSYSGFTRDAFGAFTARQILLMDGNDIANSLARRLSLHDVIAEKLRHATETKQAFAPVHALFPA